LAELLGDDVAVGEAAGEVELQRRDAYLRPITGGAPLGSGPDDRLVRLGMLAQAVETRLERAGRQAGELCRVAVRFEPGGQRRADLRGEEEPEDGQGLLLPAVRPDEAETAAPEAA
jgi:hypothetical protein